MKIKALSSTLSCISKCIRFVVVMINKKIIFPDHYKFTNTDLRKLKDNAKKDNLTLITTEKDFFRLNKTQRKNIKFLKIKLEIKEKNKLVKTLISKLRK